MDIKLFLITFPELEYSSAATYTPWYEYVTITLSRFTKFYNGDKMQEDKIGGTHSTQRKDEKCIQYFGLNN